MSVTSSMVLKTLFSEQCASKGAEENERARSSMFCGGFFAIGCVVSAAAHRRRKIE